MPEEQPEPTFSELVGPDDAETPRTLADGPAEDDVVEVPPTFAETIAEPDEIRAAEAAQQRSLCVSPDDVDEDVRDQCASDLAEALDLRVEVNRAQHDGGEVRRVGATDPRVRELEAPWTRKARRAAGSTIPNQEGQS